ncbi:unnamed protein product [Ambrosiozyma monospora]|uniref:Unnamed protein product n=1 Tax=Ambrosiozyma monospora TaxID=43982 RepID=A0ACB5U121_AMBMO|nr:unnamed protein product [Ambrosiozyma monospora]
MNIVNSITDSHIVNGSIGIVIGFTSLTVWSVFNNLPEYAQIQAERLLALACELSVQPKDSKNSQLIDQFFAVNKNNPHIHSFKKMIQFAQSSKDDLLPVVKFTVNTPERYKFVQIEPHTFAHESNDKLVRKQLPIILSWALSIHKSQGQTLSRVKVDLTRVFERGQIYVALSRCVDSNNLEIVNFDERKVKVHEDVVKFYHQLTTL